MFFICISTVIIMLFFVEFQAFRKLVEDVCTVKIKPGFYTYSHIAIFKSTEQTLTDCILLCFHSSNCLSGNFIISGDNTNSGARFCILNRNSFDGATERVITVEEVRFTYFDFDCTESIGQSAKISIDHGRYDPGSCGLPAFTTDSAFSRKLHGIKRIVRGAVAPPYSQPWLGQVVKHGVHVCGITLINKSLLEISTNWGISAAHCFSAKDGTRLNIKWFGLLFGVYDLRFVTPHMVHREPSNIVIHHGYDLEENDLALIYFSKPVNYNSYIRPICLPTATKRADNEACLVCGYGAINSAATKFTRIPRCFTTRLDLDSTLWDRVVNFDPSKSLVAKTDTCRYKGSAEGDSGGPVACMRDGNYFLMGVAYATSIGKDKKRSSYNFYVFVPKFVKWIRHITNGRRSSLPTTSMRNWNPFASARRRFLDNCDDHD